MARFHNLAAALATTVSIVALATPAEAQQRQFNVPAGPLKDALDAFVTQSGMQLIYKADDLGGSRSAGVSGRLDAGEALNVILKGTGFRSVQDASGARAIVRSAGGNAGAAETAASLGEVAGASTAAQSDSAQQPAIVVTGTHITGAAPVGAPLTTYTHQDIQRSGLATLTDFLATIPQNFNGGAAQATLLGASPNADASANTFMGSSIDIRGLGSGSTLVLLDGHRLPSVQGVFADTTVIPLTAVDHVDILADGASAVYGSDAVGGVVNLVLRRDYNGAESSIHGGEARDGTAQEWSASQSFGRTWSSGGLLAAYEHYTRDPLLAQDRSFAAAVPVQKAILLPGLSRDSIMVEGRQEIGTQFELSATALYTNRRSAAETFSGPFIGPDNTNTRETLTDLSAIYHIAPHWVATLSGTYGKVRSSVAETLVGPTRTISNAVTADDLDEDASFVVNGDIAGLVPSNPIKLAIGGDVRRQEDQRSAFSSGASIGSGTYQRSRTIHSAFGEVLLPLLRNGTAGSDLFDLSAAARYDHYSDFGDSFVSRFGAALRPLDGLEVRASFSRSFKAPDLMVLNPFSAVLIFSLPDPKSPTGSTLTLLNDAFSNPNLKPEKSRTWTIGADYHALAHALTFSVTYFNLDYRNRIEGLGGFLTTVLTHETEFQSLITRDPSPAFISSLIASANQVTNAGPSPINPSAILAYVDARSQNIGQQMEQGLDVSARGKLRFADGSLDLAANGTYIFRFEQKQTPTAPTIDIFNRLFFPTRFRTRGTAAWSRGPFSLGGAFNYTDSYPNDVTGGHISSWTTVDAYVALETAGRGPALLNGIRIALSVQNVFNQAPPAVPVIKSVNAIEGFDPANASPLGRYVSIELTKRW